MAKILIAKQTWTKLRTALGDLGSDLDFARDFIGDEAFLTLAHQFSAGEVIVACGIQDAAATVGLTLRTAPNARDQQLTDAVTAARQEHTRQRP